MDHEESRGFYGQFLSLLAAARNRPAPEISPRARILTERRAPTTLCVREAVLRRGFVHPVQALFTDAVSVESPRYAEPARKILFGAVLPEPEISHRGAVLALERGLGPSDIRFSETAFIASTHSHLKFGEAPGVAGCLGTVYDDLAFYYMADHPNRLIEYLNDNQDLSSAERGAARALIRRIVAARITKYNAQPLNGPPRPRGYDRAVLVVDQTVGDASVHFGRLDRRAFDAMLRAACEEHPDAAILVKTHPDTLWSKNRRRAAYFGDLRNEGRIRAIREPVNPFALFDLVDTVYVGSSQVGFEALMAGKQVVCFGAPVYAGWGLTDDRQPIPHRRRARSLEDLFHAIYIWYPIYHVPGRAAPGDLTEVLDFVERNRPAAGPPATFAPRVDAAAPAEARGPAARALSGALDGFIARRRDALLLRRAPLLDESFYLARYPDIAAAGAPAHLHYLRKGCAEGRDPSAAFSTSGYYRANPDVRDSGMNALVHYLRFGRAEGRAIFPAAPAG